MVEVSRTPINGKLYRVVWGRRTTDVKAKIQEQHCLPCLASSFVFTVWGLEFHSFFLGRLMKKLDAKFPDYGFASHKGRSSRWHFLKLSDTLDLAGWARCRIARSGELPLLKMSCGA